MEHSALRELKHHIFACQSLLKKEFLLIDPSNSGEQRVSIAFSTTKDGRRREEETELDRSKKPPVEFRTSLRFLDRPAE